ncbi:MAG: hypothetical protein ACT4PT_12960 [Methanobacteriota archaeon]
MTAAAGTLVVAGILHLVLAPDHFAEARGQGLFFLVWGAAQVLWAVGFLRHASGPMVRSGLVLAGVPIGLWVLTRAARVPFGDDAEAVDLLGLGTKLAEVAGAAALLFPGPSVARYPSAGARAAFLAGALVLGGVAYGAGLAAESAVPWLAEGEAHHGAGGHGAGDAEETGSGEIVLTSEHEGVSVRLLFAHRPVRDEHVQVDLQVAHGGEGDGAASRAVLELSPPGGGAAFDVVLEKQAHEGHFTGEVSVPDDGEWDIHVEVERTGAQLFTAAFEVHVAHA